MKILNTLAIAAVAVGTAFAAQAADLPRGPVMKAPAVPVIVPVFSWTGCYIGVSGGGNWGRTSAVDDADPTSVKVQEHNMSGALVGGTVGCNYQTGVFVLGFEGDGSWTNKKGSANLDPTNFNPDFQDTFKETWIATVRGRLGYSGGTWLIYVTGGGAWAGVKLIETLVTNPAVTASVSKTVSGWTIGGGWEWAFTRNWSLKAEYLYVDFGKDSYAFNNGCCTDESRKLVDHIGRIGVNFRFGP